MLPGCRSLGVRKGSDAGLMQESMGGLGGGIGQQQRRIRSGVDDRQGVRGVRARKEVKRQGNRRLEHERMENIFSVISAETEFVGED